MNAVEMAGVSKRFKIYQSSDSKRWASRLRRTSTTVLAVDNVSFQVPRGQMVGYIGPNGAGKSTTIKMLTGILVPTEGQVVVAGRDPSRSRIEVASRIGVVFGQRTQLLWDLPLRETFELLRHVYGIPLDRYRSNLAEFTEILAMEGFMQTPVRQLSLGQRMRGDLAAALLHDPEILFLDEPTIGLDVVAKESIRQFLIRLNAERQITVMLTTHDMSDVERLCEKILIIDQGRVIYDGEISSIRQRIGGQSIMIIDIEDPSTLLELKRAEVMRAEGPRRWVRFRRDEISAGDLLGQIAAQAQIRDLVVEEPAIEDVIRQVYADGFDLDTLGS